MTSRSENCVLTCKVQNRFIFLFDNHKNPWGFSGIFQGKGIIARMRVSLRHRFPLWCGGRAEGPDATITAFGSPIVTGVPKSEQKAWTCPTCTFWNTETMGRFCSMCGSRRFPGSEAAAAPPAATKSQQDMRSAMERFHNSESGDTLGESPYVFSPLPEDRCKLGSALRSSSHHGTLALEKSFTIFGLLPRRGCG